MLPILILILRWEPISIFSLAGAALEQISVYLSRHKIIKADT